MNNPVVAIACADIHLSDKAPIARSEENKDDPMGWFKAMKRPLVQLRKIWEVCEKPPILYAGDIFHHWNSSAALINFAIRFLPRGWSISGQHDIPYHSYENIERSAYYTLARTKRLTDISHGMWQADHDIAVTGFGWEAKIIRCSDIMAQGRLKIALLHRYVWKDEETKHPRAKDTDKIENLPEELLSYDIVISGDNHIPFYTLKKSTKFINCGSLMARNTDQREYKPRVWLIHKNGGVRKEYLDVSKDKWVDPKQVSVVKDTSGLRILTKAFKKLRNSPIDFTKSVEDVIKHGDVDPGVKKILQETLEKVKHDLK